MSKTRMPFPTSSGSLTAGFPQAIMIVLRVMGEKANTLQESIAWHPRCLDRGRKLSPSTKSGEMSNC